jgi:DUF971 family protein
MDTIRVKNIWQHDPRTLGIEWTDDKKSLFDVVDLRRRCPCAVCVDEWTNQRILKPEQVSDEIRPTKISSVGRYALKIEFNDGHGTGIYTFEMLRSLN